MAREPHPMLAASVRKLFDQGPAEALALWCENVDCAIDYDEALTRGLTKARLAVVSVQDRNGSRTVVLKHCPADPYLDSRDFRAYERASQSGPDGFADAHLVSLDKGINTLITDGHGGQFVMMKYLGPGPRRYYITLTDLLEKRALGPACGSIAKQVLVDWNYQPNLPAHERTGISVQKFLSQVLGARCAPGGHLSKIIEKLTEPGDDLRWPLAVATSGEGLGHILMKGLTGNAHGDLHPDNIFISVPNSGNTSSLDYENFALIDLTTFGDNRLLAVDPTHLIIDIIARKLAGITPEIRSRLEDFVIDPDAVDSAGISGELTEAVKAVHDVGTAFAFERGHYKTWVSERLAAIAACGLLFVGRAKDNDSRLWFLALATKALKKLGETSLSPGPETGTARRTEPPGVPCTDEPPGKSPHDAPPPQPEDNARPTLQLLQGGASSPSSDSATNSLTGAYLNLAHQLLREIRDLRDDLSPDAANTATTTARAIAEELSEELDDLNQQCASLHASQILALGSATATLNEVLEILHSMSNRGIGPSKMQSLSIKSGQLLNHVTELERVGSNRQSPGPPPWPTNLPQKSFEVFTTNSPTRVPPIGEKRRRK